MASISEDEFSVGDIVRLGKDDGSEPNKLYVVIKAGDTLTLVKKQHDDQFEPMHARATEQSASNTNTEANMEQQVTTDTGFMPAYQMEEWCNKMYEVKNTDFTNCGVEKTILTSYSRKGYLCEFMSLFYKTVGDTGQHRIVARFMRQQHQPRNYNLDEDSARFRHEINVFREGYWSNGRSVESYPYDHNFE